MKRPDNINDALNRLHTMLMGIAADADNQMESASVNPNHLEPIKTAALDAHLLVTWIKDNIKELHK